ncbi:MAG: cob(I)yrinic acid a,c-diamide adenosyltransferase [Deltaproteobacteria bacterium]|nr:cob(I)yrinic acid a,c-diamide adenosyltransferase [Deltaproteobacteria bacterium]
MLMRQGFVQAYTGDGKGKTTAAVGLAVRAAGHGITSYIGQFLKGQPYGELSALRAHPNITIEQFGDARCIRREEVCEEDRFRAKTGLEKAREAMLSGRYGIIVLDEINVAVWFGLVAEDDVRGFLADRPSNVEVVLTGRRATERLLQEAHLVTEFKKVKHYYDKGIPARDGIER